MKDEDVRAIMTTAYRRFQQTVLINAGTAGLSPAMESLIHKTLGQLQTELETQPEAVTGIVQDIHNLMHRPAN